MSKAPTPPTHYNYGYMSPYRPEVDEDDKEPYPYALQQQQAPSLKRTGTMAKIEGKFKNSFRRVFWNAEQELEEYRKFIVSLSPYLSLSLSLSFFLLSLSLSLSDSLSISLSLTLFSLSFSLSDFLSH